MNALKQLGEVGQSVWLDYVSRGLIRRGELAALIERDGLKGVTSNPSIFEKAIGSSDEYDEDLAAFARSSGGDAMAVYEHLAVADIQAGADVLRPVFDATGGRDGFISLEVSPYLALETGATIVEARRLWRSVGRPNLMVKVPGTEAGAPAIRTLTGEGININVTLLFSLRSYEAVAEAYIAGLEDLAAAGGDVARIASVASFFVSRIDAVVDRTVDERLAGGVDGERRAALGRLKGKVAIANAKMAYQRGKAVFAGPRWGRLAAQGAAPQRLLWASTGTKNKAYGDVLYVEALVGRDTVDTMPPATMDAFRDHGTVTADAIEADLEGARGTLATLESLGVSLQEIANALVVDGVKQFSDAADKLLAAVARKRGQALRGEPLRA
jgi:transaldolase / glucose-6-phosphate isomerase